MLNSAALMPTSLITKAALFAYQLPFKGLMQFKQYPLRCRKGLILRITDSNGIEHFAEIAPLPGFSHEALGDVQKQLIVFLNNLAATDLNRLRDYKAHLPGLPNSLQFALDSLFLSVPESADQQRKTGDATPLLQGNKGQIIEQYIALSQPSLIKLKVARDKDVANDIAIFQQLCQLNPTLKIRCDANQAWAPQQAAQFFSAINIAQLDYIEEPTNSHSLNLQLAEQYQVPIGLDETLQQTDFIYQHNPYIKAFVIKPTIIGSIQKIDQLVYIAKKAAIQLSFSSSFESIVGLQQLTKLASSYAVQENTNCLISLGIDTLKYFAGDLLITPDKIANDCQKLPVLWDSEGLIPSDIR